MNRFVINFLLVVQIGDAKDVPGEVPRTQDVIQ
jgi:hypothetical protein